MSGLLDILGPRSFLCSTVPSPYLPILKLLKVLLGTIGPMDNKQMFIHLCNLLVLQVSAAVCFWVQEEYEREGIDVRQVGYQDNRPLLELLLSVSA